MSWLNRPVPEAQLLTKARKRVAKMATSDLMEWAETAISGMGRGLSDYQREEAPEALLEIRDTALPALTALVDELLLRYEAKNA